MSAMVIRNGDRALGFLALVVAAAVIGGPFAIVLFAPVFMAL